MPTLHAQGLLLRPFELSDAPTFTEVVLESLPSLQPWAHAGYSEEDALAWFAFTHMGRRGRLARDEHCRANHAPIGDLFSAALA